MLVGLGLSGVLRAIIIPILRVIGPTNGGNGNLSIHFVVAPTIIKGKGPYYL